MARPLPGMAIAATIGLAAAVGCGAAPAHAPSHRPPPVSAPPQPTLTPVTVGIISKSLGSLFFYVGRDLGLYRRYGIALTIKVVGNPTALLGALNAGSITVAGNAAPVAESIERGLNTLRVIFVGTDRPEYLLLAKPDFRTLSQLAGHTIAASAPTQLPGEIGQELLAAYGLKPGSYRVAVVQNDTDRAALLASGRADAAIVGISEGLPLLAQGYRLLASTMNNAVTSDLGNGLGVTVSEIQSHPHLLRRLVEASLAAVHAASNDPKATIPVIERDFHLSPKDAQQAFDLLKPTYASDGKASAAAVHNQLTLDAHALHLPHPVAPSAIFDYRFLPSGAVPSQERGG